MFGIFKKVSFDADGYIVGDEKKVAVRKAGKRKLIPTPKSELEWGCISGSTPYMFIEKGIYNIMDAKIHYTRDVEGDSECFTLGNIGFYSMMQKGKSDLIELQAEIDEAIRLDTYGTYSKSLGDSTKSDRVGIAIYNKVHGKRYEKFPELTDNTPKTSFWDFF